MDRTAETNAQCHIRCGMIKMSSLLKGQKYNEHYKPLYMYNPSLAIVASSYEGKTLEWNMKHHTIDTQLQLSTTKFGENIKAVLFSAQMTFYLSLFFGF
jgi:hypothetical protein